MPTRFKRIKNKRGGQKGNQNARKHGFYSTVLNPDQIGSFWAIIGQEHVDPEMAILRVKLQSLISQAPIDRRALLEVTRLIIKWSAVKYHLNRSDRACLRTAVLTVFEGYSGISMGGQEKLLKIITNSEK
jgi:hypothetical protein